MFHKSSKNGPCTVCKVASAVIGILGLLVTIAAAIGVYKAHILSSGATFGTLNGSAAIIALVISLKLTKKTLSCCPCQCGTK